MRGGRVGRGAAGRAPLRVAAALEHAIACTRLRGLGEGELGGYKWTVARDWAFGAGEGGFGARGAWARRSVAVRSRGDG